MLGLLLQRIYREFYETPPDGTVYAVYMKVRKRVCEKEHGGRLAGQHYATGLILYNKRIAI